MITPESLKKGDKIGVVAPARKVKKSEIKSAVEIFKSWGLEVIFAKNLFAEDRQFAGTDEQRAGDFQQMLDDHEIKAIVCARGGYGTIRILPFLDFSKFMKSPKWIVGYSDITALHVYINQYLGVKSIHGIMPLNFPANGSENEATKALKRLLWGEGMNYAFDAHPLNRIGSAKGQLVGGNLSVLYSIAGTKYDINTDGKLLFLEDLDEYLYHIDRMMMNLKFAGKLQKLKGLVVGGMTDMNDNTVPFGKTAYEIIHDAVKEYTYPVCFGFPAGHIENNLAMIMGETVEYFVDESSVKVKI